jgi:hypothetical protein
VKLIALSIISLFMVSFSAFGDELYEPSDALKAQKTQSAQNGQNDQNDQNEQKAQRPSWLLTIPTAETMERKDYNLGLVQGGTIPFHADIAELWDHLELGIHGIKYQLLREKDAWISFAAGATFGFYPSGAYLVGSKSLNKLRAHLGVRFLPFDKDQDQTQDMTSDGNNMSAGNGVSHNNDQPLKIFLGIDRQVHEKITLMLEVADALNGGLRFNPHPSWKIDVGVRVGFPERFKTSLGKRSYAIGYTSEGVQPYLGVIYSSTM